MQRWAVKVLAEVSKTFTSLTRISQFINKHGLVCVNTTERGQLFILWPYTHAHMYTQAQTNTLGPGSSCPELWTADRTFHSLQSYVRFPASGWVSLPACACLKVVFMCVCAYVYTGQGSGVWQEASCYTSFCLYFCPHSSLLSSFCE